jgi:hypothetical protein
MQFLFDSRGRHVANEVNGRLHSPTGKNVGHLLTKLGVFVDLEGRYLGEVVQANRLMENRRSPHKATAFCCNGDYGDAGNYGSPGSPGSVGKVAGHTDVKADRLQ